MLSAPSVTFADGQVVAERFLIVRFVASGGMGELYEAEDRELHEHVALKTIPPEIARRERECALQARGAARAAGHPPEHLPHLRPLPPPAGPGRRRRSSS